MSTVYHLTHKLLKQATLSFCILSTNSSISHLKFARAPLAAIYSQLLSYHLNMSQLLELPDELLLKVIQQTCPDGIEDLVLCWKKLYNKSDKILEEHKSNKKKYTLLRWPPFNPFPPRHLFRRTSMRAGIPACLSSLLFEPHLVSYVREVIHIVNIVTRRETPTYPFGRKSIGTSDRVWQDFFDVGTCPYIPQSEAQEWRHKIM